MTRSTFKAEFPSNPVFSHEVAVLDQDSFPHGKQAKPELGGQGSSLAFLTVPAKLVPPV
jgi:hypothetical protein